MRSRILALGVCVPSLCAAGAQQVEWPDLEPGSGVELSAGFRYQSGETVEEDLVLVPSDAAAAVDLRAYHERTTAGRTLRGELELLAESFARHRDEDYDILSLRVGPVFELADRWRVFTALAANASTLGYDLFSVTGALWVGAEAEEGRLRWLHLRVGAEDFTSRYAGSDAWIAELELGFGAESLIRGGDALWIAPAVRHNHAEDVQLRYGQLELGAEYWLPLSGRWSLSVDATGWHRRYAGYATDAGEDRRDWYGLAGASLWIEPFLSEALALELRYEYERNGSNDRFERYDSHNPGIYLHWEWSAAPSQQ